MDGKRTKGFRGEREREGRNEHSRLSCARDESLCDYMYMYIR